MASPSTSLVSLAAPALTNASSTGVGSVAFVLAKAFHDDLSRCEDEDEAQKLRVCCDYRDRILSISQLADVLSVAFDDVFRSVIPGPCRRKNTTAWVEFAGRVQQQRRSQSREAQLLQHQTSIVALWGNDVFEHYGWRKLPLDYTRLLHDAASKLPQWNSAVVFINEVLLERHELRVVQHQNRSQLIGEHPRSSKIQDPRSPVERQDIHAVLSRLADDKLPASGQGTTKEKVHLVGGTPIRSLGLECDRFGMIVPKGKPGVTRKSSSPAAQARKRRKRRHSRSESTSESEDDPMTPVSQHRSSISAATSDSEMTDLEEKSCDDRASADLRRDEQTPISDDNDDEMHTTPEISAHAGTDIVQSSETPTATPPDSARDGPENNSDSRPRDHDLQESSSSENDTRSAQTQICRVSTDLQAGDDDTEDEGSIAPEPSTRARRSVEPSPRVLEQGGKGEVETASQPDPDPGSTPTQERPFVLSDDEEGPILPTPAHSSLSAANADRNFRFNNAREYDSPFVRSPDPDVTGWYEDTLQQEIQNQMELEMEIDSEFDRSDPRENVSSVDSRQGNDNEDLSQLEADIDRAAGAVDRLCGQSTSEGTSREPGVFSLPTLQGRFIATPADGPSERPTNKHCTDTELNDDDNTIVGRMASRRAGQLHDALGTARKHSKNRSIQKYNELKVKWLEATRWADLYEVPNDLSSASRLSLDADVLYMRCDTFNKHANAGMVFCKPIIIKQDFSDSGMYSTEDYMPLLCERYSNQKLDVQNSETGECLSMEIEDFWSARADAENDNSDMMAISSNAINLRKIANADAPLLTRIKRFRLLETLVERASDLAPGKRTSREANDISDCLGFDLLGFKGAFTRPHVDALVGTWVRCLSGSKAWIFASSMNDKDWDDFAQEGPSWTPSGKGRMVILEQDDVLLMPPGIRALHTVFTLEPSLMEGGMLWDECNIPTLLDELLWVAQNQRCTNEAIPYQLPSIIDALESWIQENGGRLSVTERYSDYVAAVLRGIGKLRELGCKCTHSCTDVVRCQCRAQERRCTVWCSKHPTLPEDAADRGHGCMSED